MAQKPPRKGEKAMRGKPQVYDELKKDATFSLTPTAIDSLTELAKKFECSRSELIERFARGTLPIDGRPGLREEEVEALAKKLVSLLGGSLDLKAE